MRKSLSYLYLFVAPPHYPTSVASVSSGCNVLYSFNKFFLSWKRSKKTLFFAVRFALTSSICFVSSDALSPRFKICGKRYGIAYSFHISIIQKNVLIYNKISIKFILSPCFNVWFLVQIIRNYFNGYFSCFGTWYILIICFT